MLQHLVWQISYQCIRGGELMVDKKTHKPITYTETYFNYVREGALNDFYQCHKYDKGSLIKVRASRLRFKAAAPSPAKKANATA